MVSATIKLSSGYEMPVVGLGTWQSKPGEVSKAVEAALLNGYKHIDCAHIYDNQKEIGQTLHKLFSEGKVKREDIFITSKVWNTFHSYEKAKSNIDTILSDLQLQYIDLLLIHWPTGFEEGGELLPKRTDGSNKMRYSDVDYLDTWKALEEAVEAKKVRSIGVSNFNHKQIERVLEKAKIKPAVNQVELHPYFQQKKLRDFCQQHNIAVTAYRQSNLESAFALVISMKISSSFSSLGNPGSAFFRKEGDPNVITDPVIKKIADAHGKSTAQVALRWAIQLGIIVIPKSVSEERIKQNADLFDFNLTDAEMKEIGGLDQGWRIVSLKERDGDHAHYPFHEEY
ncbi:hypothetical protein WR25_07300 [Diploscapter pachys]|uniref:NADP-dependent oxidoreductase domain-containing protein n=1 Tax=Diploscapter pachys TaxID=2018661 RepID=A0A2A2KGL8_9BILA|nr:hypothetical protein WR25_07300 [Diploscapter pachys]